jgi:predicted kinase
MSIEKQQPTAYIICGFIGAGKTTFARKLEKETGAIRITKDEWIVKIFGNKITSDKNFARYDKNTTELAKDITFKILRAGKDVIIDEGFWAKSQRNELKERIMKAGAKWTLYYVEADLGEMRMRVVDRSQNPGKDSFEISVEMFEDYVKYWEPPTTEEGFILASKAE